MSKIVFCTALFCALQVLFAATIHIVPAEFRSYKAGEKVSFKATAYSDARKGELLKEGVYTISIRDSGGKAIGSGIKVDAARNNPFEFTARLDRPGFLYAAAGDITLKDGEKIKWQNTRERPAAGGVAVEPERIRQAGEEPSDLDTFWQEQLKKYEKASVTVTPAPQVKRAGFRVSLVKVDLPDGTGSIQGFLFIPEKPGKYPAAAGVPGAGPGLCEEKPSPYIQTGIPAIELYMNVHLFPMGKTQKEQREKYAKYNKSFPAGNYYKAFDGVRENYIYAKAWPAVSKAIDYVAHLPEFDGKHFAAVGNSQGGGTAFALAYLNRNITCVAASVPALCDLQGDLAGRQAGWPQPKGSLKEEKAKKAYAYFDCASFAKRIRVPAAVTVGYVDSTCAPSSVYAAFNNLAGEKKIIPMYRNGHRLSAEARKVLVAFLDEQLSK
ncbi:MAG: acetylxylan esterase [Lentisphaeria bacterium]|nr:acetylxylan esterase [Lentisphaeria bacterium]